MPYLGRFEDEEPIEIWEPETEEPGTLNAAADPDQQYDDIVERRLFPAGDNEDVFLTRIAASRERLPLKEAA